MYKNHPTIAARWEKETPKGKALPEHKGMPARLTPKQKLERAMGKIAREHTAKGRKA